MVSKTQVVKFESFAAYTHDDDNEVKCDISELLDGLKGLDQKERVFRYFGEPVRMDSIHDAILDDETIKKHKNLRLIYFHMTRLRDEGAATGVLNTEDLKDLELDENEYIAEDISCLYDNDLNIVFIQKNYHSLSISGITEYLKKAYKLIEKESGAYDSESFNDLDIFFKPVPDKKILKNAKKLTNYRSLTLSFANDYEDKMSDQLKSMLGQFGEVFEHFHGTKLGVTLSAGDAKAPTLNANNMRNVVKEVESGNSVFSSALIRGKQGDGPVEPFDLLNGKLQTKHKFSSVKNSDGNTRRMHLQKSVVEDIMKLLYLKKDENSTRSFREEVIDNLR